jgi:rare lipoprotein A
MKFTFPACKCFSLFMLTALLFSFYSLSAQDSTATSTSVIPKKTFYGQASFYANKFNGRKTSSGELFNQNKMTCACNAVRLGTWLRVTNLRNGNTVIVKANDRIHPGMKRVVDLTSGAAKKLGFIAAGLARVKVEVLGKNKPEE